MIEALQKQQRAGQLHNVTCGLYYCGLVSLWFSNMYYVLWFRITVV